MNDQQLIGLSLSSCIRFIADHDFPLDRIAKIVCGGVGRSDINWEDRIDWEKNRYCNPPLFREIAETLRSQGKLTFPCEKHSGLHPFQAFGCWTTSDEFVIPAELYTAASDDFNALSRNGKIKTAKIFNDEFDCMSNTIYEFNLDDIRVIRAKHKPGFRKAIAQFFGG